MIDDIIATSIDLRNAAARVCVSRLQVVTPIPRQTNAPIAFNFRNSIYSEMEINHLIG